MLRRQKHALSQSTTPLACTLPLLQAGQHPGLDAQIASDFNSNPLAIRNRSEPKGPNLENLLYRAMPWWTFRIFFIFSARGGGWGSPRRREGWGIGFFIENPRREGGFFRTGGAGRVSAANWGEFWGGGLNIFFRGRNVHQECPFEIGIASIRLVFIRYRASIAEIPFFFWGGGGGIAPPLRMLSKGETLRKWGRGHRTQYWQC